MDAGIKVVVQKNEVQGFVDGNQVYGVYIDDPEHLRISTATAPCGTFEKSVRCIECMNQVINSVKYITKKS